MLAACSTHSFPHNGNPPTSLESNGVPGKKSIQRVSGSILHAMFHQFCWLTRNYDVNVKNEFQWMPSVSLFVLLSVCLSICWPHNLSLPHFLYLSVCKSVCVCVCLPACLHVWLPACMSAFLSAHLTVQIMFRQ